MPARSVETSRGIRHMVFQCEVCGSSASFGFGVQLRRALSTGNVRYCGLWACDQHRADVEAMTGKEAA